MTPEEIERNRLAQMQESARPMITQGLAGSSYAKQDVEKWKAEALELARTGGPAFPITGHMDGNDFHPASGGMALRDYFAAHAPANCLEIAQQMAKSAGPTVSLEQVTAKLSYHYADAMLAERAKSK